MARGPLGKSLVPADAEAEALLQRMPRGEVVEVEVKRPRNPRQHRLLMAVLNLVLENTDDDLKERLHWVTLEDVLVTAKIRAGHYDRRDIVVDGKCYPVLTPRSIAFASLAQDDFQPIFERIVDWVSKDILPGITRADILAEAENMIGLHGVEEPAPRERAPKPDWEATAAPAWWLPLTALSGYRKGNHSRAAQGIAEACAAKGVSPATVIERFADEWPTNKLKYRWTDPVATLKGSPLRIAIERGGGIVARQTRQPERATAGGW